MEDSSESFDYRKVYLSFWYIQLLRFKKQVDDVSNLENITKDDMHFLHLKAKAIVDCYLQSEVVPRVQVRYNRRHEFPSSHGQGNHGLLPAISGGP